jgi:hypothetical protein
MAVLLCGIPASAEITGVKITKEEALSVGGKTVRHVAGAISGKADENYRRKVSEAVDRLIQDRFLPESARANSKYVTDAEKASW